MRKFLRKKNKMILDFTSNIAMQEISVKSIEKLHK
jgi:hypothetical protein